MLCIKNERGWFMYTKSSLAVRLKGDYITILSFLTFGAIRQVKSVSLGTFINNVSSEEEGEVTKNSNFG